MAVSTAFNDARTLATIAFAQSPGNILTAEVVVALSKALHDLRREPHVRCVAIAGDGADFSFGASVAEHRPKEIGRVLPLMHALIADVLETPAPTAAIVRGRCLGGGFELALACDYIFAEDDATFGLPEIALGVFPPAASVLLPLRVGAARALPAILGGRPASADEWRAQGLIERTWPAGQFATEFAAWFTRTLAPHSAEALRHAARATRRSLVRAVREDLPEVERLYLQDLMRSHDATEGIDAFLEKRAPRWEDR
jgi:cyclohexa-1,5-dienecarbonyl-CoA hydratase